MEVYDGVASLHDSKCAAIIAKLHIDGRSSLWQDRPESERELKAAVATMDVYHVQYLRLIHQLESWLARYWPEVTQLVALTHETDCIQSLVSDGVLGMTDQRFPSQDSNSAWSNCLP